MNWPMSHSTELTVSDAALNASSLGVRSPGQHVVEGTQGRLRCGAISQLNGYRLDPRDRMPT